jgi:hypothetical protein
MGRLYVIAPPHLVDLTSTSPDRTFSSHSCNAQPLGWVCVTAYTFTPRPLTVYCCVYARVCALVLCYLDDPRILLDDSTSWHSSGWKLLSHVQMLWPSLMVPPLLYETQMYAMILISFLTRSTRPDKR